MHIPSPCCSSWYPDQSIHPGVEHPPWEQTINGQLDIFSSTKYCARIYKNGFPNNKHISCLQTFNLEWLRQPRATGIYDSICVKKLIQQPCTAASGSHLLAPQQCSWENDSHCIITPSITQQAQFNFKMPHLSREVHCIWMFPCWYDREATGKSNQSSQGCAVGDM